jgi:hypothetical protein
MCAVYIRLTTLWNEHVVTRTSYSCHIANCPLWAPQLCIQSICRHDLYSNSRPPFRLNSCNACMLAVIMLVYHFIRPFQYFQGLSGEDTNIPIDTARGDDTSDLSSSSAVFLLHYTINQPVGVTVRRRPNGDIRRPPYAGHKMPMTTVDDLDTFALLR